MPLTEDQVSELKAQLHQQISHLPDGQRQAAAEQIDSMSSEALEAMLSQQRSSGSSSRGAGKTIFRSIIDNEIESISVQENASAKAVMDIAPISKGHVLIIPKKPVSDAKSLPVGAFSLAKNIARRVTFAFKAKSTIIQTENKFGETVIHVIPSYTDQPLDLSSQRTKTGKDELDNVARDIRPKEKKRKIEVIKKQPEKAQGKSSALQMRRRVP